MITPNPAPHVCRFAAEGLAVRTSWAKSEGIGLVHGVLFIRECVVCGEDAWQRYVLETGQWMNASSEEADRHVGGVAVGGDALLALVKRLAAFRDDSSMVIAERYAYEDFMGFRNDARALLAGRAEISGERSQP